MRTFLPAGRKLLIPDTGSYSDRMVRLAREAGRMPGQSADFPRRSNAAGSGRRRAGGRPRHLPCRRCVFGNRQWRGARPGRYRRGGARSRTSADRRCGVRVRRAAAGSSRRSRRSTPWCSPPTNAWRRLPGMAFAVARIDRLEACAGNAGSWSFDLARHPRVHACAPARGSSRFTPPAQVINALNRALDFHEAEGQPARLARYTENMRVLYDGVQALGLTPCLRARAPGAHHRQRARAGRSRLGPSALRRCAEAPRRADQQFLQHTGPQLSRRLHRRHHA